MAEAFHRFARLPCEIRAIIWKLAIRDRAPGAHMFSMLPPWNTHEDPEYLVVLPCLPAQQWNIAAPNCRPWPVESDEAGITLRLPTASKSWTRGNPSTYLVDDGLWKACRESRKMVEAEYKLMNQLSPAPLMLSFETSGLPGRRITFFPTRDLVILQVRPRYMAGMNWPFPETDSKKILQSRRLYSASQVVSTVSDNEWLEFLRGLEQHHYHLGLEYDPSWNTRQRREFVLGLSDLNRNLHLRNVGLVNVWLIDYRLKRTTNQILDTDTDPDADESHTGDDPSEPDSDDDPFDLDTDADPTEPDTDSDQTETDTDSENTETDTDNDTSGPDAEPNPAEPLFEFYGADRRFVEATQWITFSVDDGEWSGIDHDERLALSDLLWEMTRDLEDSRLVVGVLGCEYL